MSAMNPTRHSIHQTKSGSSGTDKTNAACQYCGPWVDIVAIPLVVAASVFLWRKSANMGPLNDDRFSPFSANAVATGAGKAEACDAIRPSRPTLQFYWRPKHWARTNGTLQAFSPDQARVNRSFNESRHPEVLDVSMN